MDKDVNQDIVAVSNHEAYEIHSSDNYWAFSDILLVDEDTI